MLEAGKSARDITSVKEFILPYQQSANDILKEEEEEDSKNKITN
jgi:hypothetical protein